MKSSNKVQFEILTLFPEVFPTMLGSSLIGKAIQAEIVSFQTTQIRNFTQDKHRTVDDTPYGGGEGMLLRVDVLHAAWKSATSRGPGHTVLLSPQGQPLTQKLAQELATHSRLILICGHYEGVDERFVDLCVDREVSIGDYVLTGGELPAMVLIDAVTRVLPGVVGNERSISEDSLQGGLLKYPQYTKPREYEGLAVPEVLLGGNHKEIAKWRDEQRQERTLRKRPDLLKR